MTTSTDYVPLTLTNSSNQKGVKHGTLGREGTTHSVTVHRFDGGRFNTRYDVYLGEEKIGSLAPFGNGRNRSWSLRSLDERVSGNYPGTLEDNADRLVRQHLQHQEYAAATTTLREQVSALLPYEVQDKTDTSAAYSSGPTKVGIISTSYQSGDWVGYHYADEAEDIAQVVRGIDPHATVKVFGKINHQAVIDRLKELGIAALTNADGTQAQVYIENGSGAVLLDKATGNVEVVTWDASGGVSSEQVVGQADSVSSAVEAIHRWYASYDLQQRAQSLLEHLETEVPSGVAHYAVEQAKKALHVLQREAFGVDCTYGRDYSRKGVGV